MIGNHQRAPCGRAVSIVLIAVVAVVLAGCGSGTTATVTPASVNGGTLVLGAGGEPACATWILPCSNNVWGLFMMQQQTLPRPFAYANGGFNVTALLAGEPKLETGPPMRVTYHINPRAVWSDGQPITSTDFKYTYGEALQLSPEIKSVDDSDPRVAIVTFSYPFPEWHEEFAPLLPAHLLQGKDRDAIMHNGYSFSGGPWMIDHWTRGVEVKLVPNPRYWGEKPKLNAVVFKIFSDSSAYAAAYQTGQIDVAYFVSAGNETAGLRSVARTRYQSSLSFAWYAVWFNTQKPPLDSLSVRQALAYATDRTAIATQVYGAVLPGIKADQAFMSPANSQWYSQPFSTYTHNLSMTTRLMTTDGWTRGSDGVWVKGATRAALVLSTTAGNHPAELEEQIIQSEWKEAGFDVTIDNSPGPTLLGDRVPKGNYQVAIFGLAPQTADPGLYLRFGTKFIPTSANGYQGGNITRIANTGLDAAWQGVEQELNVSRRLQLVNQAQQLLAQLVPVLPISGLPNVLAYNTAKVGGPTAIAPTGPFDDLNQWYCASQLCR